MDQQFVAGIGNLYSDEILFAAGLRYDRPVRLAVDDRGPPPVPGHGRDAGRGHQAPRLDAGRRAVPATSSARSAATRASTRSTTARASRAARCRNPIVRVKARRPLDLLLRALPDLTLRWRTPIETSRSTGRAGTACDGTDHAVGRTVPGVGGAGW